MIPLPNHSTVSVLLSIQKVLPLDVNFWQNQSGLHPSVGTVITQQEIDQGNWLPAQESYKAHFTAG